MIDSTVGRHNKGIIEKMQSLICSIACLSVFCAAVVIPAHAQYNGLKTRRIPLVRSTRKGAFEPGILLIAPNMDKAPKSAKARSDENKEDGDKVPQWQKEITAAGGTIIDHIGEPPFLVLKVKFPTDKIVQSEKKLLSKKGMFKRIEHNVLCVSNAFYNDELAPQQYQLTPANINTFNAIPLEGGLHPKVVILDSGIEASIDPELDGIVRKVSSNFDLQAADEHGHLVAAVGFARCNNQIGGASAGGGDKKDTIVFSKRIVGTDGFATYFTILKALAEQTTLLKQGKAPRVANLSYGPQFDTFSNPDFFLFQEFAYQYALAGGVLCIAAGNDGLRFNYPRSGYWLMVAASNRNGKRASFSNFGKNIDCAAPGASVITTLFGVPVAISGTSFSAPQVASVAAWVAAKQPSQSAFQIIGQVLNACRQPNGQPGYTQQLGFGIPDLVQALK